MLHMSVSQEMREDLYCHVSYDCKKSGVCEVLKALGERLLEEQELRLLRTPGIYHKKQNNTNTSEVHELKYVFFFENVTHLVHGWKFNWIVLNLIYVDYIFY